MDLDSLAAVPSDIAASFSDLSFTYKEVEAAMLEAALQCAADAVAQTCFEEVARGQSCALFADALKGCGLMDDLPALHAVALRQQQPQSPPLLLSFPLQPWV